MISITKSFEFAASHRLHRSDWGESKNLETFGKCANPQGHGHNYILEVSVSGSIDPETGMIIDASKLQKIVEEKILSDLDHKNLDADVTWLKDSITTVENLIDKIWTRLAPEIESHRKGIFLEKLQLRETSRIFVVKTRN